MSEGQDLRAVGSRIEELLGQIRPPATPAPPRSPRRSCGWWSSCTGPAWSGRSSWPAQQALDRLVEDELVASLLVLHDLHPKDTETRVVEALDQVRPYLGSHAGGVELLGVDPEGVVHLRLEGSCDGCPSSTMTVKLAIERAIEEAAPEVTAVEVENLTREKEPQLLQIQPLRREWEVVDGLEGLEPGRLTAVEVAGAGVVVCSVGGELYAYRDRCPACGAGLAGGPPWTPACWPAGRAGQRFDVRLAGRGVDQPELHLVPLPLLAGDGRVRLAVGSGAAMSSGPTAVRRPAAGGRTCRCRGRPVRNRRRPRGRPARCAPSRSATATPTWSTWRAARSCAPAGPATCCSPTRGRPAAATGRCPTATCTTRPSGWARASWEALQIPVRVAFFFNNSDLGRVVAFYPSPAGATESLLPLEAWAEVVAANPVMTDLVPDVEALLVRRAGAGLRVLPGPDRRLLRAGRPGPDALEGL